MLPPPGNVRAMSKCAEEISRSHRDRRDGIAIQGARIDFSNVCERERGTAKNILRDYSVLLSFSPFREILLSSSFLIRSIDSVFAKGETLRILYDVLSSRKVSEELFSSRKSDHVLNFPLITGY